MKKNYRIDYSNNSDFFFLKEKLDISERNYQSLEHNYKESLSENNRLLSLIEALTQELNYFKLKETNSHAEMIKDCEELRHDNEFLAKTCSSLKKEIQEYSVKLEQIQFQKHDQKSNHYPSDKVMELESLIIVLKAENERLHGLCEEYTSEFNENFQHLHSKHHPYITSLPRNKTPEEYLQFSDHLASQNEVSLWKGKFFEIERTFSILNQQYNEGNEKFSRIASENERLYIETREKDIEINRLQLEWREAEKLALLFPELKEQINKLLYENERLKTIIRNRCRDLTNSTWEF